MNHFHTKKKLANMRISDIRAWNIHSFLFKYVMDAHAEHVAGYFRSRGISKGGEKRRAAAL